MNHPLELFLGSEKVILWSYEFKIFFKGSTFPLLTARYRIQLFVTTFGAASSLVCKNRSHSGGVWHILIGFWLSHFPQCWHWPPSDPVRPKGPSVEPKRPDTDGHISNVGAKTPKGQPSSPSPLEGSCIRDFAKSKAILYSRVIDVMYRIVIQMWM